MIEFILSFMAVVILGFGLFVSGFSLIITVKMNRLDKKYDLLFGKHNQGKEEFENGRK